MNKTETRELIDKLFKLNTIIEEKEEHLEQERVDLKSLLTEKDSIVENLVNYYGNTPILYRGKLIQYSYERLVFVTIENVIDLDKLTSKNQN